METIGSEGDNEGDVRRDSSKVSLERYRQVSGALANILHPRWPG